MDRKIKVSLEILKMYLFMMSVMDTYHCDLKWLSRHCESVRYLWCHFLSSRICNPKPRSRSHILVFHLQRNKKQISKQFLSQSSNGIDMLSPPYPKMKLQLRSKWRDSSQLQLHRSHPPWHHLQYRNKKWKTDPFRKHKKLQSRC